MKFAPRATVRETGGSTEINLKDGYIHVHGHEVVV